MKKTFTINISGTLFYIEEDAYEKLHVYLAKLKEYFGNSPEGREIVADMEMRLSELFTEMGKGENKIIVSEWVDEAIATMGTPEDFKSEEGDQDSDDQVITRRKRRLYRKTENRVFAGVCSGLAAYFKIDPLVMRILFVVLFFADGVGFLAYLILWIAVPKAQTTAQRLEMRGEEVTISNIERSVKEDLRSSPVSTSQEVDSSHLVASPDSFRKKDHPAGESGSLLRAIAVAIGIVLILVGFLGLLGFISTVIIGQTVLGDFPSVWNPDFPFNNIINQFITPSGATWGMIFLAMLAGIPLLAMLYAGTKIVFRYHSNSIAIGLAMFGLWLLALIGLVAVTAKEATNFRSFSTLTITETLPATPGKPLYLEVGEDKFSDFEGVRADLSRYKAIMAGDKLLLLGEPRLKIEKSENQEYVLIIKKQSRGRTESDAEANNRSVIYDFQCTDSILSLDPWFLPGNSQWRDQRLTMTLKVPEGGELFLSGGMEKIIHNIENISNVWDHDMIGKMWIMLPEGLAMKDVEAVEAVEAVEEASETPPEE